VLRVKAQRASDSPQPRAKIYIGPWDGLTSDAMDDFQLVGYHVGCNMV